MNRDSRFFKFKSKTIAILRKNKGAIFSGVLIGTSYIPFPPWALLFCLIPLWLEVLENQESFWSSFARGWWTQFILSLIGFYWIAYVSHEFGYMPWPVALLVLLLFVATVHTYYAVAAGGAQWLRSRLQLSESVTLVLLAAFTGLGEIYWPSLFPWNFGYTFLWMKSPIAQTADVFGFQGLSLLVLFANAGLTWAFLQAKNTGKYFYLIWKSLAIIGIFAGLHFWGLEKRAEWRVTDSKLNVLQIQANIGNFEKVMAEKGAGFEQSIVNQYFELTREGLRQYSDIDLVIWPESAYPDYLEVMDLVNRPYANQFQHFLKEIKKPILTGGYAHTFDAKGLNRNYNGLFLYGANGQLFGSPYHKTNLLVFGEYTPLTDYFPILTKISPAGEGWSRGTGPQIIPFNEYKIGPQICYESLYPEFSAELAHLGADILVNLTNDSWFGPTSESHQHMMMTLARGVETRRPLLRTTNTGITTAILADGTQLQKSAQFTPWYGRFEIPFKKQAPMTFFTQYHSWLPLILLLIVILSVLIGKGRAKKMVSKQDNKHSQST